MTFWYFACNLCNQKWNYIEFQWFQIQFAKHIFEQNLKHAEITAQGKIQQLPVDILRTMMDGMGPFILTIPAN